MPGFRCVQFRLNPYDPYGRSNKEELTPVHPNVFGKKTVG